MRTEYKVIKPFGCAKKGDIFELDYSIYNADGDISYEIYVTESSEKGNSSRYMSINKEYVEALVKGGNLKEWGKELTDEDTAEEDKDQVDNIPSVAELKLMALEAFLDDCANKYQKNLNKVQEDYNAGKVQPCVKVESETVNYNLIKFIKAVKQILDVDKANDE